MEVDKGYCPLPFGVGGGTEGANLRIWPRVDLVRSHAEL